MSMFRKVFKPIDDKDSREGRDDIKNIEYKRKIDPLFRDPCGKGHLHILLEHGYDVPSDVDYVLSCGCDVNTSDNDNNYPIHIAVTRDLNKCVRKLIQRNSLLDVFNNDDVTPLMIASQKGHADNVFNLLQNGANPNLTNKEKRSAMHYVSVGGDVRCLKILLEARGKLNHQDSRGYTPLLLAAKHGHADVTKCLLEHKAFPKINPNKADNEQRTPLHWAVENGHSDVIRLLLAHGVDTSLVDGMRDTAFSRALKSNRAEVLQQLIEHGCDRGLLDGKNGTCLGLAALFGYTKCLQVLLKADESPDDVTYFGITPLMTAVFESHDDCVRLLLDAGASVDKPGRNGTHALPLAFLNLGARNDVIRHRIVRMLLRAGSRPNLRLTPSSGPWAVYLSNLTGGRYDMLSLAMLSGYMSMTQMLLLAGSHVTRSDLDELSSNSFLTHGFRVSEQILRFLQQWVAQPRTLKALTRTCIRHYIGYEAEQKINQLPIAKPLKQFLNLIDLDYIDVETTKHMYPQFTISASNFVSITPCGMRPLRGSLLYESVTPTLGLCRCDYCRKYEETVRM